LRRRARPLSRNDTAQPLVVESNALIGRLKRTFHESRVGVEYTAPGGLLYAEGFSYLTAPVFTAQH